MRRVHLRQRCPAGGPKAASSRRGALAACKSIADPERTTAPAGRAEAMKSMQAAPIKAVFEGEVIGDLLFLLALAEPFGQRVMTPSSTSRRPTQMRILSSFLIRQGHAGAKARPSRRTGQTPNETPQICAPRPLKSRGLCLDFALSRPYGPRGFGRYAALRRHPRRTPQPRGSDEPRRSIFAASAPGSLG